MSILLVFLGVASSALRAASAGSVTWRRTALDGPFLACGALLMVQLVVGNRRLVAWALGPPAPPAETFPAAPIFVGSVAPAQTLASLVMFLAYVSVYYLVVHAFRERRHLSHLIRFSLVTGAVVAFGGLVDYLSGESWIFAWREVPLHGRLAASFVNPDHFATWLAMLICLGAGYVMAARQPSDRVTFADVFASRTLREEALKRSIPLFGCGVMLLALVFTLSRGAIVALAGALLVLVVLLRTAGRVRVPMMTAAALVAVAAVYSAWIGLAPLIAHVGASGVGIAQRLAQYRASVTMLLDFPILGVGLGAYRAIYPRYQPLAHDPGGVYYPYAHSDLLQFVIETGAIGLAVLGWAAWRGGRDLIGAHCLGRGACPVGAGEGPRARRSDPYGVPVAMGAMAGVVAVAGHAATDFSLRIPANGFLAAALLGIATVALHTRFGTREGLLLSATTHVVLPRRRALAASAAVVVLSIGLVAYVVRGAIVDGRLAAWRVSPTPARAAAIVAADGADARGLAARAVASVDEGIALATRGNHGARPSVVLGSAVDDLRQALRAVPTEPTYHEGLAAALAARLAFAPAPGDREAALAHFRRAIQTAPENGALYLSLFRFAFSQRPALLDVAFGAARSAIARDGDALGRVVDVIPPQAVADDMWLPLVPGSPGERLRLALALEAHGLPGPAIHAARGALELPTTAAEDAAARWVLSRLLVLSGDIVGALKALEPALVRSAGNPEIHFAYATALRAHGDPRALDAFRSAVDLAAAGDVRDRTGTADPFPVTNGRLRAALAARAGASQLKYRKALASYLSARGLTAQALRAWSAVVALDGRDAEARAALAAALEAADKPEQALEESRQAVALDGRPAYRSELARRLWRSEQYFQAMTEWRTILEREPTNRDARLSLARALVKAGDARAALGEYQRLVDAYPGDKVVAAELEQTRRTLR